MKFVLFNSLIDTNAESQAVDVRTETADGFLQL